MPPGWVRYRLLGALEVDSGQGLVPLGGRRQHLLLTVLLLDTGHALSTDRLCEVLWPDEQPDHPAAALRSQVARLRRTLSALSARVRADANGYRLDVEPNDVDVHRFEALVETSMRSSGPAAVTMLDEALRLWRGPLPAELSDCPLTQPTAVRLEEMRVAACERRAELLLALGRPEDIVAELRALVTEHPERERVRSLLMEALTRTGRHTEALAEYRSWCAYLAEVGLEPSPDLRQMQGDIIRHTLTPPSKGRTGQRVGAATPATSFIGRADELAEVIDRLAAARLVTVAGPGGVGKTRLALAATSPQRESDRVAFVDLSVLNDAGLVAASVADAIDLSGGGGADAHESLAAALADRPMLLVVDNCEHVLETVADLVEDLLARCPQLTVLTTSREPLGLPAESVVRLTPLTQADAAALFVERATDGGARLALDRDWPIIEDICSHLDRLPLAIELAAKHADHLPMAHLRDLLQHRFQLLVDGAPRGVARQRTLEATLRWSHELLDDHEQQLLRRLAVFTGPFTIHMANRIDAGTDEITTARRLGALHRKSLVAFDHHSGRYRLLETVREFARARLVEHDESDATHRRLYEWLLHDAPAPWRYPFTPTAIDEPDGDLDNLRGTLHWCAASGRVEDAAVLAAAYGPMWFTTIRGAEALRWLILSSDVESRLDLDARLACRTAAAYAAFTVIDVPQIHATDDHLRLAPRDHSARCPLLFAHAWRFISMDRPRLRRELDTVRDVAAGDPSWLANCDLLEGLTWLLDGNIAAAINVLQRAVTHEESGKSLAELNLAVAYHLAGRHHDVAAIVAHLQLSDGPLSTWFFGDVVGAMVLVIDAVGRGDLVAARDALVDTLVVTARRYAHVKSAYAFAVIAAGIVAYAAGEPDEALTLLAGARHHRLHLRYEGGAALAQAYERRCRRSVTDEKAKQAVRRGRSLTIDTLVNLTRHVAEQPIDKDEPSLTGRGRPTAAANR